MIDVLEPDHYIFHIRVPSSLYTQLQVLLPSAAPTEAMSLLSMAPCSRRLLAPQICKGSVEIPRRCPWINIRLSSNCSRDPKHGVTALKILL